MNPIFAEYSASITELKKNPSALIEQAHGNPIVILNHNRPTAYLLAAETFELLLELLDDVELAKIIKQREAEKKHTIKVNLRAKIL